MKILVTGGAGYIGSTLVPMLLDKGHEVTVFDTLNWGVNSLLHVSGNTKLNIIKGDITDKEHIGRVITGKDAIVHLAAIVGYPACDKYPDQATETNVEGTKNVVNLKLKHQILVYASTGSCYGSVEGICTENTKLNPLTLYAKTKAEADEIVQSSGGIALRFATLFGLSARLRLDLLINEMTFQAVCRKEIRVYEGHFRRTFLHVYDAALAIIFALDNSETMFGNAYNVGDDALNFTKLQVAQIIQNIVSDCTINEICSGSDMDKRDYEVSYKKIKDLGYRSTISIKDGIKTIASTLPLISVDQRLKYHNV